MDMKCICAEIAEANDHEITEIVNALIERQKILHPDWEAMYISLPINHPEKCKQIMCGIWGILQKLWWTDMGNDVQG